PPPTLYTLSLHDALPISLAGWAIHVLHPGDPRGTPVGLTRALHAALALLTLQQELPYPEPDPGMATPAVLRVLQALWFLLPVMGDRKSTRLNSSHLVISY